MAKKVGHTIGEVVAEASEWAIVFSEEKIQ